MYPISHPHPKIQKWGFWGVFPNCVKQPVHSQGGGPTQDSGITNVYLAQIISTMETQLTTVTQFYNWMTPKPDEMSKNNSWPCGCLFIMTTNPREKGLFIIGFEGLEETNAWG